MLLDVNGNNSNRDVMRDYDAEAILLQNHGIHTQKGSPRIGQ